MFLFICTNIHTKAERSTWYGKVKVGESYSLHPKIEDVLGMNTGIKEKWKSVVPENKEGDR